MATTSRPASGYRELLLHRTKNLKVVPPGSDPDPMQTATTDVRVMMATQMRDGAMAVARAEQRKAETEEKRAEVELRKLEREEQTVSGETGVFQQYLVEQLNTLQRELIEVRTTLSQKEREDLESRLQDLKTELAETRQSLVPVQSGSALEAVVGRLEEYQSLVAVLKEIAPQQPAPPMVSGVGDPAFVAWKDTFDFRKEQWREERKERTALLVQQNDNERYRTDQEMEIKREQVKTYNRALDETLPRIGSMLSEILDMFRVRITGPPAAAAAPESAPAQIVIQPPAGATVESCPGCGAPIIVFDDTPHRLVCMNCARTIVVSVPKEQVDAATAPRE